MSLWQLDLEPSAGTGELRPVAGGALRADLDRLLQSILAHGVHVDSLGTLGGPALPANLHPPQPFRHRTDLEKTPRAHMAGYLQRPKTPRRCGRGRYRCCRNEPHVDFRHPGLSVDRHETLDGSTSVKPENAEIVGLRTGQVEPPDVAWSETRHGDSKVNPRSRRHARRLRTVDGASLSHGIRRAVTSHRPRRKHRQLHLVWLNLARIALRS